MRIRSSNYAYAQVIEEHNFTDRLEKLKILYPRVEDVNEAVSWLLGKNPTAGTLLKNSYYVIKTMPLGITPSFWILYQYDQSEQKIYLLSVEASYTEEE